MYKAKVGIKNENWNKRQIETKQTKKQGQKAKQNIWDVDVWSNMKRKKKKKKKKWEKKWDYIDERMNDWDAERKVSDWNASLEMNEEFDEKHVIDCERRGYMMKSEVIWFR